MRSPIDIHEFSTGINFQILDDSGRWVSSGFTGQYMNNTLAEQGRGIPPEVEQAIANREFAVSEGAYTKEPAIIARDLPNSPWSAIAVVSRGEDEKGRSASFYRYFLCESPSMGYGPGEDGISILLNWMTERRKEIKQWPQFHPQRPARSLSYQSQRLFSATPEAIYEKQTHLQGTQAPYIWQAETGCVPLTLHGLTLAMRQEGAPLAWAFNAGALEKPWSFTIISPASAKAEGLIRRAIANPPAVRISGSTSEQALSTAIKAITTTSTIKPDAVRVLFATAASQQVSDDDWLSLFDKRGTQKAISHGIHSAEMIKLMLLRTLILPHTLLQLLKWLGLLNKRQQPTETETIFVEFQRRLSLALNHVQLGDKVNAQIDDSIAMELIPALLRGAIEPDDAYRLLSMKGSFWRNRISYFLVFFEQGIANINANITLLRNGQVQQQPYEERLWYGIYAIRGLPVRERYDTRTYYDSLIQLLKKIGNSRSFSVSDCSRAYQLAAYLEHISKGRVASDLYKAAFPNANLYQTNYLQERIERDVPIKEEVINKLGDFLNMQVKMLYVLLLSGTAFLFGTLSGALGMKYGGGVLDNVRLWPKSSEEEQALDANGSEATDGASSTNAGNSFDPVIEKALPQYESTARHLQDIVIKVANDLESEGITQDIIAARLFKDILQVNASEEFDYGTFFVEKPDDQKREIIKALRIYQSNLEGTDVPPDGVIRQDDDTIRRIEENIREYFQR